MSRSESDPPRAARPDPSLQPEEVVRAQLEALRTNGADDAGIATAFAFASPSNREQTGPLDRFARLVRNPTYSPMLGFREARIGPAVVAGDQAQVPVVLADARGDQVRFLFVLSRQGPGPYQGCWMTDGVVRTEAPRAFLKLQPHDLN